MNWLKQNGYECAELTVDDFRAAVSWGSPHASPRELVRIAQQASRATGVKICGGLYHISDGTFDPGLPQQLDFEMPGTLPFFLCHVGQHPAPSAELLFSPVGFWQKIEEKMPLEAEIGSEYITFQICLPERHMNTGGAYRNDEQYLDLCAQRIARLQVRIIRKSPKGHLLLTSRTCHVPTSPPDGCHAYNRRFASGTD